MLGQRIQEIAEEIHKKQDPDNKEVNLLLWRSGSTHVIKISSIFLSNLFAVYSFILLFIKSNKQFTYSVNVFCRNHELMARALVGVL